MEFDAKGVPRWNQKRCQQKSMPKLVTKKMMKIIKNHVSLKSKIIEIHCTNQFVCDGLEGCIREWKRYQKNIKSKTKIHPQIDEQSIQISCSKKGYPQHENSSNKWSKKRWSVSNNSKTNMPQTDIKKRGPGPERNSAARRWEHYKIKDRR